MDVTQKQCPHILQVDDRLLQECAITLLASTCLICKNVQRNFVCLQCAAVLCARSENAHMVDHCSKNAHTIALSLVDLSFWCYACDCSLSHLNVRVMYDIYCMLYYQKFNKHTTDVFLEETKEAKSSISIENKVDQTLGSTAPYKPYRQGRFQRPSLYQQMTALKITPRVESRIPPGGSIEELQIFAQMFPAFLPILLPQPGDWLAENKEDAEDLVTFVCSHNKMTADRKVIYILPLGDLNPDLSPSLESLRLFAEAFFGIQVTLLPAVKSVVGKKKQCVLFSTPGYDVEVATRLNGHTQQTQFMAGDLCNVMSRFMPKDTYSMIGVTMTDLYSASDSNFVFGQANLRTRMGVFSFARYSPLFMTTKTELSDDEKTLFLRRSCRVLVHEVFHMFGAGHCVYANCCMNGANHLEEDDTQPLVFCPCDLAKLYCVRPFRLSPRLESIRMVCQNHNFAQDVEMIDTQLLHLRTTLTTVRTDKSQRSRKSKNKQN